MIIGLVQIGAHKVWPSVLVWPWLEYILRTFTECSGFGSLLAGGGLPHVVLLTYLGVCPLAVCGLGCCLNLVWEPPCGSTHASDAHSILVHAIRHSYLVSTSMRRRGMFGSFWLLWGHTVFHCPNTAEGAGHYVLRHLWEYVFAATRLFLQSRAILGMLNWDAVIAALMTLSPVGIIHLWIFRHWIVSKVQVGSHSLLVHCIMSDSFLSSRTLMIILRRQFRRFTFESNQVQLGVWEI